MERAGFAMMQKAISDVRPSPIAGQWYPGIPGRLTAAVDKMLASAPPTAVPGKIIGLIAPHAGYVYSGPIAARAFRLVLGMEYERVVLVSPMHHAYLNPVLTTGHQAFGTPLGAIPVDHDALDALRQHIDIKAIRDDPEHSLEIELPFLQCALDGPFTLVPLMLRDQTYQTAAKLGQAVAEVIGTNNKSLLVASSDLSHFYTQAEAQRLDQVMLDRIEDFDPEGVIRVEDEGRAFACGRAAIAAVLVAARALGANTVKIVGYGTSADASGDSHRVVGYGAAAIYQAG